MKTCLSILVLMFFLSFPGLGQNSNDPENTIEIINSLAKNNKIELCEVNAGGILWGGKKYKFSFEGNLLVLELERMGKVKKAYYNMDKLVSFYINDDRLVFNFQS